MFRISTTLKERALRELAYMARYKQPVTRKKTLTFSHKSSIIREEFSKGLKTVINSNEPYRLKVSPSELEYHIKKDNLDINSYIKIPKFSYYKELVFGQSVKSVLSCQLNKHTLFLDIEIY